MFKHKMRSARGMFSSKPDASRPTNSPVNPATMKSLGEPAPAYVDSVMAPDTGAHAKLYEDGGAFNEPLVLDIATIDDVQYSNKNEAPRTPVTTPPRPSRHDSWLSDDDTAPAPQIDFSRRGIHIPSRTSSITPRANRQRISLQRQISGDPSYYNMPTPSEIELPRSYTVSRAPSIAPAGSQSTRTPEPSPPTVRSSAESTRSYESTAPSLSTQHLVPLQQKGMEDGDRLSPLMEDDPHSFDLISAPEDDRKQYSLETRSEQLFSKQHLQAIFADTSTLLRFTSFLSVARPKSVPVLIYYLDALKALRAISYANAVAEALEPIDGLQFTETPARSTLNTVLEDKANRAFEVLVRDDLPAFITHIFVQVASVSIAKRVTGNLSPLLREASEGLAEVFCLTDPSRTDNPIIFASEEFHRTTQYGVGYAIGRNCRFLQGPKTNPNSVARFGAAAREGRDHSEVFLNYRRDGSPFMNLLMIAPLLDSRGTLRYFIGAQIDVSGLVKESSDLEAFQRMLAQQEGSAEADQQKDEFQALSEMFNNSELDTVRKFGGNMHREHVEEQDDASVAHRPRLLIQDQSTFDMDRPEKPCPKADGKLSGPYKHYLVVRPAPSLRILFTSPSLRVPGVLQSRFLDRIGGSGRVRDSLRDALADGTRGVTAKIRWLAHAVPDLASSDEEGRPRWIHCTPLLGANGSVGVWMVVLVDEKEHSNPVRRFRQAPPIPNDIRGTPPRHGQHQPLPQNTRSRFDALDYEGGYNSGRTSGPASPSPYANGTGRHNAVDTLRYASSPNRSNSPGFSNPHVLRSGASSVKDYGKGPQASVDSFVI